MWCLQLQALFIYVVILALTYMNENDLNGIAAMFEHSNIVIVTLLARICLPLS
jgi:hypothetical protein